MRKGSGLFFIFDKLISIIERATKILIIIIVGSIGIILSVSVFTRYVLRYPIIGADEISLYLLAWITLLGAVLSVKNNQMVSFNFLLEKLPSRINVLCKIIVQIMIILFSIVFLTYSIQWIFSPTVLNATSPSLQIPMWAVYFMVPVSMIIIILFCIYNILNMFNERRSE